MDWIIHMYDYNHIRNSDLLWLELGKNSDPFFINSDSTWCVFAVLLYIMELNIMVN